MKTEDMEWYKANAKVMRMMTRVAGVSEKVSEILEFDKEHLYCMWPKGSVLEFWCENAGKEFEVRSDELYFGYVTVFLKGEKMRFEGSPYYHAGATVEEKGRLEEALNWMSARWREVRGKGDGE